MSVASQVRTLTPHASARVGIIEGAKKIIAPINIVLTILRMLLRIFIFAPKLVRPVRKSAGRNGATLKLPFGVCLDNATA